MSDNAVHEWNGAHGWYRVITSTEYAIEIWHRGKTEKGDGFKTIAGNHPPDGFETLDIMRELVRLAGCIETIKEYAIKYNLLTLKEILKKARCFDE